MLDNIWKSWNEIKDQAKDKQIFLFGRSEDWVHKTLKLINALYIKYLPF